MKEEETGMKKRVGGVESLGWLTESSVMPKKQKAIEGVGASSILELKAQLYKTQQEAKKAKDDLPADFQFQQAKAKPLPHDVFSKTNSGVQARAHKDKLELKAVTDGSASYAALERKAELYDKLVRGELPDEEEKEKYCVDFFQKGFVQDVSELRSQVGQTSPEIPVENEDDDIDASTLPSTKSMRSGSSAGTQDPDEHKRFVREVHEEANIAREKASALKLRRQEQTAARRDKFRQAYLLKQLEKMKARNARGAEGSTS